jgi:integrase
VTSVRTPVGTPTLTYALDRPISPDTVSHYAWRIATKAGVDTHLHGRRHFVATQMIGGGHDVRTMAGRWGSGMPQPR